MARETLKYKGFDGSIEPSIEDGCLYGSILFIRDKIIYEGATISELRDNFESAVDAYVETCELLGKDPQKPCNGVFQVRLNPELHQKAQREAYAENVSLNEYVKRAISDRVERRVPVVHYHQHRIVEAVSAGFEINLQTGGSVWHLENESTFH